MAALDSMKDENRIFDLFSAIYFVKLMSWFGAQVQQWFCISWLSPAAPASTDWSGRGASNAKSDGIQPSSPASTTSCSSAGFVPLQWSWLWQFLSAAACCGWLVGQQLGRRRISPMATESAVLVGGHVIGASCHPYELLVICRIHLFIITLSDSSVIISSVII